MLWIRIFPFYFDKNALWGRRHCLLLAALCQPETFSVLKVVVCSSLADPQCQSECSLKPGAQVSRAPTQGVKYRGIPEKQLSNPEFTGSSWVGAKKPRVGFLTAVPQAALTAELFAHHSAPQSHSCTVSVLSSTAGSSTQGGAAGPALGCWQCWPSSVRSQCSSSHSIAASS